MNKILVTGGAGFIGSNLCEHLLAHNYEVVCLDNFATGKPENVFPLLERYSEKFKLIVGDIRVLADCRKAVEGVDYVMHEAALGSVPRSIKDPITTNDTNISGFLNMLVMTTNNKNAVNQIYNTAYGERTTLNQLVGYLKEFLSEFDSEIIQVEVIHGPNRLGDIPHSLACIDKAKSLLGYNPQYSMREGLKEAVKWYWNNLI